MKLRSSVQRRHPLMVAVILCLLLILLFSQGFFTALMSPFLRIFSQAGTALSVALTSEEQQRLEAQIQSLATDALEFDRLQQENTTLKEELGFLERTGFQAQGASILTKSLSQTVARFVLDAGAHQGVQIGDPVVSENGLLVGRIIQTENESSTAIALTDPTHATAVSLVNDRRTIGVAYGSVSGLLEIRFIPTDEHIEINDLVVTSGLEETIPSGLLIGLVNAIELDPSTLFHTAILEPLQDIRRLSHVLILIRQDL